METIAIISGDTHLKPNTWVKHPDLRGDAYYSLQQLVDECCRRKLPLILAGDVFDRHRPDSESVTCFMHEMDRMQQARLAVYFIQGNHDKADPPWCATHAWPISLHESPVNISGLTIYGIDYQPAGLLEEYLARVPAHVDLLVTHQSWAEAQGIGHVDGTLASLPRGMTVISGDFHTHAVYHGTAADGGGVTLYSPGSTCMQAINEEPTKRYYMITRHGLPSNEIRLESLQLTTRPYCEFTANNDAEFENAIDRLRDSADVRQAGLPESLQRPLLRANYADTIPEAYTRLIATLGEDYHIFPYPREVNNVVVEVDAAAVSAHAFDDLLSAVAELVPDMTEVREGVTRLLQADDPQAEIIRMFEEYNAKTS